MPYARYRRRVGVSAPGLEGGRVVPRRYCPQGEGGGSRVGWGRLHTRLERAHALVGCLRTSHEAARLWRISWDVAKFAPNVDASSSPRPLEVIWSSHTDH